MNIWIVNHYAIPPSMGGLVRHYYFSKYLEEKGHHVKIFTSSKIHNADINIIQDKRLYAEKSMDGIEYTFVKSRNYFGNGLRRILNMVEFPFKINQVMKLFAKKEYPDVIYTSSPDLFVAFFALRFGRKRGIPVVTEIRDLWPESIIAYNNITRKNLIIKVLYQLEKWIYKKSDRLIFTMAGGAKYIKDKNWDHIINLDKVYHVNNGIDLSEVEENQKKFKISDEELEDDSYFKIIYAGSIRRANGVELIVEVAALLQEQGYENIRFLIYGDGTELENIQKICDIKGLRNVFFKGKVEKKYIPYILSRGNLNFMHGKVTHIMKYGCSPNKLFDYIASGVPILSDLTTNFDLIKQYNLGYVVENPTPENIAKEIIKFTQCSKEDYNKICYNNSCLKEEYDYKNLTNKVEKILQF